MVPAHHRDSKVELKAELDNPRIVACRDDATEDANTKDLRFAVTRGPDQPLAEPPSPPRSA